jgi:hypothetical protein
LIRVYQCRVPKSLTEAWRSVGQTGEEAAALAGRLRSNVFGNQANGNGARSRGAGVATGAERIEESLSRFTGPLLREFQDLPRALEAFAMKTSKLMHDLIGKKGYEEQVFRNRVLVTASEYVRRCTGKYYDERVSELMQGIVPDPSGMDIKDFSGEAIRKRRNYFKKEHPLVHAHIVEEVRLWRSITVADLSPPSNK